MLKTTSVTLLAAMLAIGMLGMAFSNSQAAHAAGDKDYLPPTKQVEMGVDPEDVECQDERVLLLRTSGAPICALPESVDMVVERGIAAVVERDPADMKPAESDMLTSDLLVSMTVFSDRFAEIKDTVVEIARDAIAAYESEGEASLDAMTAGSSTYDSADPYPFVVDSETMIIVAHGFMPERVGMLADPFLTSGMTFDELRSELESEGSLWLMYTFIDPESSKNATKKAYLELHDGLIFGSGFYPNGLEVQMMKTMWVVNNAVEMYDESGVDAFDMITEAAADYVSGDIYPFASSTVTMNVVAHGADPSRVGVASVALTDSNKDLERILLESEMNGGTWVSYTFTNFETSEQETKLSWIVVRDDYVLGAGFYPDGYQASRVHAIMSTDNALFLYAQYGEDAFPKITALNVTEEWYPFVSDDEIGLEIADGSILDRTGVLYWDAHEFNAAYGPVMDVLESGHGAYISYVFLNPETGMQQAKKAWIVLHDGYIFGAGFYLTGEYGDKTAVKWSVDTSVEMYKLDGAEATFAAITAMESTFESYPFVVDSDSFDLVAHGADPGLVGSNLFEITAPDKDMDQIMADLSASDTATAWIKYTFANPETGMDSEKSTLLRMHDGYIFAAGYYHDGSGDDAAMMDSSAVEFTADEQAWLDENPSVVVALDPSWPPYEYVDESGNMAGVTKMLAEKFSAITGSEFVMADPLNTWNDVLGHLRNGTAHVALFIEYTEERDEYMDFTGTWHMIDIGIIVSADSGSEITPDNLADYQVVTISGYAIEPWLDDNMPDVEYTSVDTPLDALGMVLDGSADAYLDPWATTSYVASQNGIEGLKFSAPLGKPYELSVGYAEGDSTLGSIMKKLVDSVSDDEIEAMTVS